MQKKAIAGSIVRSLIAVALTAGVIGATADRAQAQGPRSTAGEQAVEYRQSLMTVMIGNFRPLYQMVQGKGSYDIARAVTLSERVAFIASMVGDAFPAISNGADHTKAKPSIWTDPAGFQNRLHTLIEQTRLLEAAAKSGGGVGSLRGPAKAVGDACQGCHDNYRNR